MKKPIENPAITISGFQVEELHIISNSIGNPSITADLKLDLETSHYLIDGEHKKFITAFEIELQSKAEDDFLLRVKYSIIFNTNIEITDEFMTSDLVIVNSAAIGFPYVRAFVSNITLASGYRPVILPTYNFTELKEKHQVSAKKAAK